MIFKSSFKGEGMTKYGVFAILLKIDVWASWIYFAIIPYGGKFIDLLQASLNNGVWDIRELLTPILMIILWFGGLVLIEIIIGFGIFYIAKVELENRNSGRFF